MTGDSPRVYIVGSLRNPAILPLTRKLEAAGFLVFSDWFAAGRKADDEWAAYEKARGRTYREALASPAAQNVFKFDLRHLIMADFVVLLYPAGRSGHLELGFAAGQGKATFILMDEPDQKARWDVMALFAGDPIDIDEAMTNAFYYREPGVAYSVKELITLMQESMQREILDAVPDNARVM